MKGVIRNGIAFLVGVWLITTLYAMATYSLPTQRLICSTGVGQHATVMAIGNIQRIGEQTYLIKIEGMPDQFITKGAMDVCAIANIPNEDKDSAEDTGPKDQSGWNNDRKYLLEFHTLGASPKIQTLGSDISMLERSETPQ